MSINVTVSGTSVGVSVSAGIGPAGFITAPGTNTSAFGTFQLVPGSGVTISTSAGQYQIASYNTTQVASFAPVQSVAGRTGAVVLQAADITAGTFAIGRIPTIGYTALSGVPTTFAPSSHTHSTTDVISFTAAAAAAAPVQSVQARTGAVVLTRADITAAAETHTHAASDITSGTFAISFIPTGTSSSSVCVGNDARLSDARPISWAAVPASSTATGTQGSVAYDADHVYLSVGTNSWKRLTLGTW